MEWQKIALTSELDNLTRKAVQVGVRKVLIIHFKDEFLAVDNSCPHMRFPLNLGSVTDDCGIICPFHHSAFDLRTGDVKDWSPWPPGLGRVFGALSRKKALPVFETKIEDGYLWVSKYPRKNG
jgi:nitrite reductase/ring-hydroxylating ferredoxin subunit